MTAEGCKQSAEDLVDRVGTKLDSLATAVGGGRSELQSTEQTQEQETRVLRTKRLRQMTRLPNNFHFPSGSAFDCWLQWSVGNATRHVSPLQLAKVREFMGVLDRKPKTDDAEKLSDANWSVCAIDSGLETNCRLQRVQSLD